MRGNNFGTAKNEEGGSGTKPPSVPQVVEGSLLLRKISAEGNLLLRTFFQGYFTSNIFFTVANVFVLIPSSSNPCAMIR